MTIEEKISELGLSLPAPSKALGSYSPCVVSKEYLFISGIVPVISGAVFSGKFGEKLSIENAKEPATAIVLTMLSNMKAALGNLENISRIVRIEGFINSTADFSDQPKVLNEVSELLVKILSDKGIHSRIAIGVSSLPLNACMEVSAIVEIKK